MNTVIHEHRSSTNAIDLINRSQEPGESIASYLTELSQHESITPDDILRDRIVLGIRDDKIRERLLRLNDLTLQKAVDLIKAAEQTEQQVKLMSGNPGGTANVNALKQGSGKNNNSFKKTHQKREVSRDLCGRCGTKHAKKNCQAFAQKCRRCGNLNHYQSLCRTKLVGTVSEEASEEDESYEICTVDEDSRPSVNKAFVDIFGSTKKPGNQVRFQVDTGSECNLLPIKLYKSLTGDTNFSMLRKCHKPIVSYTGKRRQITGKINLRVWHKRSTQTLTFNVIDGEYQPILSLNTSIALGIVTLHDCDVLSLTISSRSNAILEEFKDAFEGLG